MPTKGLGGLGGNSLLGVWFNPEEEESESRGDDEVGNVEELIALETVGVEQEEE